MPVEIRELVIRAKVDQEPKAAQTSAASEPGDVQQELVDACVRRVLDVLAAKQER